MGFSEETLSATQALSFFTLDLSIYVSHQHKCEIINIGTDDIYWNANWRQITTSDQQSKALRSPALETDRKEECNNYIRVILELCFKQVVIWLLVNYKNINEKHQRCTSHGNNQQVGYPYLFPLDAGDHINEDQNQNQ